MNKIVVGLTGVICGGKSKVADMLSMLGCAVVDTDVISRKVTANGTIGARKLAEIFPDALNKGVIDRRKLREIVFNDAVALKKLNSVTHPLIAKQTETEIRNCENPIVIAVVPLLFETGLDKLCDVCVTVSCDEKIRIDRLIKRDNIDENLARKIVGSQMTDAEREFLADTVIRNDGDEKYLSEQVERVFAVLSDKVKNNKDELQ